MIKLHPEKKYSIPYKDEKNPEIDFSITFKFPYTEDIKSNLQEDVPSFLDNVIKGSIEKVDYGIIDETTNEILQITDNNRKLLIDLIKTLPDYVALILSAFIGPTGKNFLTGVTPSLTTDGPRENVSHASLTVQKAAS